MNKRNVMSMNYDLRNKKCNVGIPRMTQYNTCI